MLPHVFFTLAILGASAKSPEARLKAAEAVYDDYRFEQAIKSFNGLLADPSFDDGALRQRARHLLAFSLYVSHREDEAKEAIAILFRENVDYTFNRKEAHPDLLRFFDTEHNRYVASLQVKPVEIVKQEVPPPPPPKPIVQTIGDRHPWVRIFPLGLGHFLNNDPAGGAVYLSLELGLVGANVTLAVLREGLRGTTGRFRAGTNATPLQIAMNVTLITAMVVAVVDIIDAFVWSPSRGRARLQADLGPLGVYQLAVAP